MVPKTFEQAFEQVKGLAARFATSESAYLSPKYQEAEVRQDFLDKFFVALGWDVYHESHPNPYEREVRIERSVMVENRGKRADYAFFTAPNFLQARFMAEAKKPSRQLANPDDCFQAARYGWNSNTPLAVLTDFEQFVVLDSRYKPTIERATARILDKFHYKEFEDEERFRQLYYLFSRESVGDGSIEKYVAGLKKAKVTKLAPKVLVEPVGDTFLAELDTHREELARSFKRARPELDGEELTEITQRTLDRLVFVRFLEDKLVEPSEIIDRLGKRSGDAWTDLAREVPRLNSIYNGIIFKPHSILDATDFAPDGRTFQKTVDWLSHKNSAYDFNTIPIHILGSIYERFLGKTITVTDKRAKVEEKAEVRKAGGVYYTPEYIVTYIVENTIGKLVAGKSPDEIAKMRFADIACGSGSFLLGIFDYLIKYHVEWYSGGTRTLLSAMRPKAEKPPPRAALRTGVSAFRQTPDGNLQLTLEHKRDILLNNIYGVDLDAQAVEVAQLSLYLKLLEEETAATVQPKLGGLREQLLPSLDKNIVHGNSLIDWDMSDGQLFEGDELRKLWPMNFKTTFPEVFANGGFDAIVGNPPYDVLEKERKGDDSPHAFLSSYVRRKADYESALGGKLNLFRFFVLRAIQLTKNEGRPGLIVPLALAGDISCAQTREYLLKELSDLRFDCFPQKDKPNKRIFLQAKLSTVIFTGRRSAEKTIPVRLRVFPANLLTDPFLENRADIDQIKTVSPTSLSLPMVEQRDWDLCVRLHASHDTIQLSGLTDVFQVTRGEINQTIFREFISTDPTMMRLVKGVEIGPFIIRDKLSQGEREWFDEHRFLQSNNPKPVAKKRRIATQRITGIDERLRVVAMIVEPPAYFADSTNSIATVGEPSLALHYLLALLNSKLMQWRFKITSTNNNVGTNELLALPIRSIDYNIPAEKAMHDRVVELVERMIEAKRQEAAARTDRDRAFYERMSGDLDAKIDDLVYQLYDITPEERRIVEGH